MKNLQNPILNAIYAFGYIVLIVLVINFFTAIETGQESLLIPMVMLGLFVISSAVMAILFFYQPFQMYLEGRKTEALKFFGKTLLAFIFIIILILLIILLV